MRKLFKSLFGDGDAPKRIVRFGQLAALLEGQPDDDYMPPEWTNDAR